MNKNYLNLLHFKDLRNWQYDFLDDLKANYHKTIKLSEVLTRVKNAVDVQDDIEYKRVTIKSYGKGIVLRDIEKGDKIKTKKQYVVSENQLLLSKIDARNGAFGLVPAELDGAIITGNFWTYQFDESKINIMYLITILSSEQYSNIWEECSNGSGNRRYLNEEKFLNYLIPYIDKEEQDDFEKKYKSLQNEIERLQKALHTHTHNASHDILYKELAIDFQKKTDDIKADTHLRFADFSTIANWDAKMIDETNISCLNSARYKNIKLKSLATVNPKTTIPIDLEITFVPMENISEVYGDLKSERYKNSNEAKGYTKFKEKDIAWAKITPCMENGKSFIASELKNGYGIGTTELHIVRNNDDEVLDTRYLFHLLRSNMVRENAVDFFTGTAGQKRVKKEFLEDLLIPLPNIETQREIAQKIDNAINDAKDTELKIKQIEEKRSRLILDISSGTYFTSSLVVCK